MDKNRRVDNMGNRVRLKLGGSIKHNVRNSVTKSVKWKMRISENHLLMKGWGSIRTPINTLLIWRITL